jgi:hypothetical protein
MTVSLEDAARHLVAPLQVERGRTFMAEVALFKDKALTEPFDLAGWTVHLNPAHLTPLTVGDGLLIPSENVVVITLSAARTLSYPAGVYHYRLWLEREETKLTPVVGPLEVENA